MASVSQSGQSQISICFPFIGDELGGSHISALKLSKGLDPARFRVQIVLHVDHGNLATYLKQEGLNYALLKAPTTVNGISDSFAYAATMPRMISFLRKNNIDIVHTNDGRINTMWALPARLSGAKLLWHHRSDPAARSSNLIAPILANHIVTVSKFAIPKKPILRIDHKTTVVHSPFEHPQHIPDRQLSRQALLDELKCPPSTRFAGYFGFLIERKRPLHFVDVIAAFAKHNSSVRLDGLIFGQNAVAGTKFEQLIRDRAQQLGIADRIHIMGFRRPIEPFMRGVDVNVVTALSEPFGRTLIESMMLGTPVVATRHGGNTEAIVDGENGFLVDPDDASAFVDPISRLLNDQKLFNRISSDARSRALINFSSQIHVDKITKIYLEMVKR